MNGLSMAGGRFLRRRVIFALSGMLMAAAASANPLSQPQSSADELRGQLAEGKGYFATVCAGCHGATGEGNTGPRLAGRDDLDLQTIAVTVLKGRPGTPMPSFEDNFDAPTLSSTVAYVDSLASGGHQPKAPVNLQASMAPPVSSVPVPVGGGKGVPLAGSQDFFDPLKLTACRSCHSYKHKGGVVGPDLATLGLRPAAVLDELTHANAAAPAFPASAIVLRDGSRLKGIDGGRTDSAVKLYDVSAIPPVLRTIPRFDIARVMPIQSAGVFDHSRLPYSRQERLDISVFVGQPPPIK